MKSPKTLIIVLVVLVAGLGYLMRTMNSCHGPGCGHSHENEEKPKPPPAVQSARERDLNRLCDPKTKNWEIDPKLKVVTTKTGLKYQDIKVGKGAAPKPGDVVVLDYVGWISNGRRFDTSLEAGREPFGFKLGVGDVIKGWDEGISTMRVGGIRRLVIPPELGYGEIGVVPTIEPNATLVFMVKLMTIKPDGK